MKHVLHFEPFGIGRQEIILEGDVFTLSRNDGCFSELVKKVIRSFQDPNWLTFTVGGFQLVIHAIDEFRLFRHAGPPVACGLEIARGEHFKPTTGCARHPFRDGAAGGVQ